MDAGEGANLTTPPKLPDDVEFEAEIVEITFKTSIKTALLNTTINPPHWEKAKEAEIVDDWAATAKKLKVIESPYSKRAATYLVRSKGGPWEVEVKVKVKKSKNVSGDGKLRSKLRGLEIEGTCPTGVGDHTVVAKIVDPPDTIQCYRGDATWSLELSSPAAMVVLGKTLLEVYFILDKPTKPYDPKGVWAEALRFVCGRLKLVGKNDVAAICRKVTTHCHGKHGLRYEIVDGEQQYQTDDWGASAFKLKTYLECGYSICNCSDQAAAVQTLCGTVGVRAHWYLLDPFGYLNPTNLVGVGMCNNPFFLKPADRMVPPADPKREPFSWHAFCGTPDEKVLDACAGPHTGTETKAEYVTVSVDADPALYGPGTKAQIRGIRAGTSVDTQTGVTGVV